MLRRSTVLRSGFTLLLALAGCAPTRPPVQRTVQRPVTPAPAVVVVAPTIQVVDDETVGRWIAVDVVDDADQTADLRRGVLEKTLVINPGGHVILRGVDRAPGGGTAAFTGRLIGRVVTFAELPGAAYLAREGTRLVLIDPTGRRTRFVRDAD